MSKTYKIRAKSFDTAMRRAKIQFGADALVLDTRHLKVKDPEQMGMTSIVELTIAPGHPSNHGEPDARLGRLSEVYEADADSDKAAQELRSDIARIEKMIRSVTDTERRLRQSDSDYPLSDLLLAGGVSRGGVGVLQSSFEERVPASERANRTEALKHLGEYLRCVKTTSLIDIAGVHLFVGSAGSGKTSTVIKLASALAQAGKNVAVIVAAPYHGGEVRRVEAAASALMIDAAVARDVSDLNSALRYYADKDAVLIDTPCWLSSQRPATMEIFDELRGRDDVYKHYVCALTNDLRFILRELEEYRSWNCDFLALSKLDLVAHAGKVVDIAVNRRVIFSLLGREDGTGSGVELLRQATLLNLVMPQLAAEGDIAADGIGV